MTTELTRSDITSLTIDQAALVEMERLWEAGELGDGYKVEPRCYVCCEEESRDLVNKLIAAGLTNRQIAESCRFINARRLDETDNGDAPRLISARNILKHRREHFNVDRPAAAVARAILERRAEELNRDHINGIGHAVTGYALMETMMVRGYEALNAEGAPPPTYKEALDAAVKLHELTTRDAGQRKMAELIFSMQRIIDAAQEFVPPEQHENFLARVEGRPLTKPMAVLAETAMNATQQVRVFTPDIKMDEGDALD